MHYRWEETDKEGIIRSLSWRLYQVGIRWRSVAPVSESLLLPRGARRELICDRQLRLFWVPCGVHPHGRVSDVTLKRSNTSAIFPADPRPERIFFLNPLKTADFVIRKSGLRIEDAGKYSSPRLSSLSPRSLSWHGPFPVFIAPDDNCWIFAISVI